MLSRAGPRAVCCVSAAGVSVVFACTKSDVLKDSADPEGLQLLSHALRWTLLIHLQAL